MKYIIIGLGKLGKALAQDFTLNGHEVIGVDMSMVEVDAVKGIIATAICMDTREENTIKVLPLKDADAVYVTYGEDFGVSIHTAALLKQCAVKKLVVRSISPLHETVLRAIGVSEIISPEDDYAHEYVANMELGNKLERWYRISPSYHILKVKVPKSLLNVKVKDINFQETFHVKLIAIIRGHEHKSLIGGVEMEMEVLENINDTSVFSEQDELVIFGKEKYYNKLL